MLPVVNECPSRFCLKSKVKIMTLTLRPHNGDMDSVHCLIIETKLANLKETLCTSLCGKDTGQTRNQMFQLLTFSCALGLELTLFRHTFCIQSQRGEYLTKDNMKILLGIKAGNQRLNS